MKGQYGDHLRASEVRDVLVMYMKKQGWDHDKDKCIDKATSADQEKEKDSVHIVSQTQSSVSSSLVSEVCAGVSGLSVHDRSCVCIPPGDGLYSLALVIEKNAVTTTTTASATTNTSTSSSSGSGSNGSGSVARPTSTSSSSLISPPPPSPSTSSLDELTVYEDDDDGEGEGGDVGSRGGGTVGGVWMPAVGGSGAWSGSSGGVRSGIATSGSNSNGVGGFQRAANGQGPALLSIVAGENNNRPGMRGSSSVGGWGVDKGAIWRPTSLPSANPTTPATKTGVSAGGKINSKSDKQIPTKSSTTIASSASSSSPSIAMAITVRKEDLMKTLLKKLTPYFAIVGPNGQAQISSGRLPTVQVAVEARMGNKVVTHIRGLELFGVDVVGLAKDCQKRFACAATTGPVVEKGGNVC